jgi:hypothetical protein
LASHDGVFTGSTASSAGLKKGGTRVVIRQIALTKFKNDTADTDVLAMGEGFERLVDVVPGILRFEFGPDLGLEDDTLDYALVIDFESVEVWRSYRAHPTHVAFAEKYIPLMEDVVRVQYRVSAA